MQDWIDLVGHSGLYSSTETTLGAAHSFNYFSDLDTSRARLVAIRLDGIDLCGHPSQTLATETLLYDVYEPQKKGCEQADIQPIRRLFVLNYMLIFFFTSNTVTTHGMRNIIHEELNEDAQPFSSD